MPTYTNNNFTITTYYYILIISIISKEVDFIETTDTIQERRKNMKKIALPVIVFVVGLVIAKLFFGVDVEGLTEGFLDFLGNILKGSAG